MRPLDGLYLAESQYVIGRLAEGETPPVGDTTAWAEWLLGFVDGMVLRVGETYLVTQDVGWLMEFRAVLSVQVGLCALAGDGRAGDDGVMS